jgi:pyruvate kinase
MALRKTKLIATIGPACDDPVILEKMIAAGMDVARLNLSHGTLEDQKVRLERLREVAQRMGANVATLIDTRGFEIRTGRVAGGGAVLVPGMRYTLRAAPGVGDQQSVSVSFPGLAEAVTVGQRILIDDGKIELVVEKITGADLECEVTCGGTLRDRKGVNLPETDLQRDALDSGTHEDLGFAAVNDADYLAASFVQTGRDVDDLRGVLESRGADIPIIAKIENRVGVRNLDEIVDRANGTMVARGDLGVELPMARVPTIQKQIIRTTVSNGKPVITATQMLDSMERNPRPTRAEVSDVANAILDGSSAVMLSGETAAGQHPVEAVRTMSEIAREAEASLAEFGMLQQVMGNPSDLVVDAVAQAAITMANHLGASAIIALTDSGFTARSISKFRPASPILALTHSEKSRRRLAMNWGVTPILYTGQGDDDDRIDFAVRYGRERGYLRADDIVVATAGRSQKRGGTDMIQVRRV